MSGMIDPEMLGLLWNTPVGTVFILRVVGLSLLFVGLFLGRIGMWISIIGGISALWSFAQIGHVSGNKFALAEFALLLHLLAIAFWIGILIPLKAFGIFIQYKYSSSKNWASFWHYCFSDCSNINCHGWVYEL